MPEKKPDQIIYLKLVDPERFFPNGILEKSKGALSYYQIPVGLVEMFLREVGIHQKAFTAFCKFLDLCATRRIHVLDLRLYACRRALCTRSYASTTRVIRELSKLQLFQEISETEYKNVNQMYNKMKGKRDSTFFKNFSGERGRLSDQSSQDKNQALKSVRDFVSWLEGVEGLAYKPEIDKISQEEIELINYFMQKNIHRLDLIGLKIRNSIFANNPGFKKITYKQILKNEPWLEKLVDNNFQKSEPKKRVIRPEHQIIQAPKDW